jgi:hypothetical protein
MPPAGSLDRDGRNLLIVFTVGWALAAWTHLMGNTRGEIDVPHLALLAAVVVVLARPARLGGMVALSLTVLWTAWDEAPQLSNHWTLVALISVALLLVAVVATVEAVRTTDRRSERQAMVQACLAGWFIPAARWTFLAFYLFASFAKLNAAFFDPAVSCAIVFLDESLTSIGLGGLGVQDASAVQWTVIGATAAVELAIPWLLMVRRTRIPAVALAVAFHAVLSIDKAHQIVDFSSLLTVLYLSFLPAGFFTRLVDRCSALVQAAAGRYAVRVPVLHAVGVGVVVVLGLAAEGSIPEFSSSRTVLWWLWQAVVAVVLVVLIRYVRRQPDGPARPLGRPPAWLLVVPALAFVNGLLPYLEVRTAGSWNMYANLRVVDGDSNHFVIRRGLPLTDEHRHLVEIVSSSDPGLQRYALQGLALTRTQLRIYVADHPDVAITYRYQDELVESPRAGDDPLLNEPVSLLREKFQVFRAVTIDPPEQCLPLWGVAR